MDSAVYVSTFDFAFGLVYTLALGFLIFLGGDGGGVGYFFWSSPDISLEKSKSESLIKDLKFVIFEIIKS